MTVYKIQNRLTFLTGILFIMSLFFTFSVYKSGFSGGPVAVCVMMVIFLGLNLLVFITKKITVEGGEVSQKTLYGSKQINVKDIEEIGVVNLRWRIILILSDPEKFVFISSMYENFDKFMEYLKNEVPESSRTGLSKVSAKAVKNKNLFLMLMLIAGSLFFLLSGFYNLLYR